MFRKITLLFVLSCILLGCKKKTTKWKVETNDEPAVVQIPGYSRVILDKNSTLTVFRKNKTRDSISFQGKFLMEDSTGIKQIQISAYNRDIKLSKLNFMASFMDNEYVFSLLDGNGSTGQNENTIQFGKGDQVLMDQESVMIFNINPADFKWAEDMKIEKRLSHK